MLLATYNIHFAYGADGTEDLDRVTRDIENADIVCLQEVGQHWRRNDFRDQAAEIAARLNYHYVFGSAFDVDASYVETDGRVVNRRRTFGNMVASRWPIRTARMLPLPKRPAAAKFDLARCAVEAVVQAPAGDLRVYSVHISHASYERRLNQINAIIENADRAPEEGGAWDHTRSQDWTEGWPTPRPAASAVIMGDLNFVADDPEYAVIAAPPGGNGPTWHDAWRLAGHAPSEGRSLAHGGKSPRRIDHAFVTSDLAPRVRRAWIDNTATGSDHYPLFVELAEDALDSR